MLLLKDRRPPARPQERINRPRAHQRRRTLEVQCLVAAASDIIAVARNASRSTSKRARDLAKSWTGLRGVKAAAFVRLAMIRLMLRRLSTSP
jgi:hypothetical protein